MEGIWNGFRFLWKVYETGTFSVKNGIQKGKGLDLGAEHPPPSPGGFFFYVFFFKPYFSIFMNERGELL